MGWIIHSIFKPFTFRYIYNTELDLFKQILEYGLFANYLSVCFLSLLEYHLGMLTKSQSPVILKGGQEGATQKHVSTIIL